MFIALLNRANQDKVTSGPGVGLGLGVHARGFMPHSLVMRAWGWDRDGGIHAPLPSDGGPGVGLGWGVGSHPTHR